ncbi:hypothetical protein Q7P37_005183 [Cladosporium fusiforme]
MRHPARLLALLLPLLLLPAPAHAILRLKLQHWFPNGEHVWRAAAAKCESEITAYLLNNRTEECRTPCSCAADCILDDIPGTLESNFASAQVVLGLVPATAFAGCTGRPGLSNDLYSQDLHGTGSIANGAEISVYTDLRTISGWRCGALFMPLVWFNLSVVEHGVGMIAARFQVWPGLKDAEKTLASTHTGAGDANLGTAHAITSTSRKSVASTIADQFRFKPLVASQLFQSIPESIPTVWSELIFWIAQACALVHMIFGIFVLSSLVFITALDAVMVFARFAASVVFSAAAEAFCNGDRKPNEKRDGE